MPTDDPSTLRDAPVGIPLLVLDLEGGEVLGPALMELGLMPGAAVRVIRRAPLGGPIEIDLGGARFAMRPETAATVSVREA